MALVDLWVSSRDQLKDKHVQQIISFAGDGRLLDGGRASDEFRALLAQVPSTFLVRYASECLTDSFPASGLALQDVVNEIGRRLGFEVTHGRYRGTAAHPGFDGVWKSSDGHSLILEVKTTDAYRIDLDTIAGYRRGLIKTAQLTEDHSSVLIVVGRQDTGDLEAQIRGSRHAWDVRLISTEALLRLLSVKEEVEDPQTQKRIHAVLRPREFTRLDQIVDILFSTAEDIRQEQVDEAGPADESGVEGEHVPKFTPVAFHEACVHRLEQVLGVSLVKRSRAKFLTPDDSVRVICTVSKEHTRGGSPAYWFAFHPHQGEFLATGSRAYVALGCGSENRLLLIPYQDFAAWLEGMNETSNEDRSYKHVSITRSAERLDLVRRQGWSRIDLTQYLVTGARVP